MRNEDFNADQPGPERPAPEPRERRAQTAGRSRSRRGEPHAGSTAVVGYCRRSTDRQEQSIPDQQRAIEKYCDENGHRIDRWYIDDAISGTSALKRPAFQELISDAQQPGRVFRYVVVYDVKRFGRVGNDEAGYYRHILQKHGVDVLYVSEGFNGGDTDDLLRPVKQWQAREESRDLSKVTIRGLLSKSDGGWWMGGAPPYGYDLAYETDRGEFLFVLRFNPDGSKAMLAAPGDGAKVIRTLERGEQLATSKRDRARLVPSTSDRVLAVQTIFRMAAIDNKGFRAIVQTLNGQKAPTPRGPQWSRIYSGEWTVATVRSILLNPIYSGDMVWNRRTDGRFHRIQEGRAVPRRSAYGARLEPNEEADWIIVRDAHEPLVERRLIELAKQTREARETSQKQKGRNPRVVGGWNGMRARYLLSGLCECARCRSGYEGVRRTKGKPRNDESKVVTYSYCCGGYIRRGASVCRLGSIPQGELESTVIDAVLHHYDQYRGEGGQSRMAEVVRQIVGGEQREVVEARQRATDDLARIKATITRLLDNISPVNRAMTDERLKELGLEREAVERKLEEVDRLGLAVESIQGIVRDSVCFLRDLEATLRGDNPEARIAAIRQCVQRVIVDWEAETCTAEVRAIPSTALKANPIASIVRQVRIAGRPSGPASCA